MHAARTAAIREAAAQRRREQGEDAEREEEERAFPSLGEANAAVAASAGGWAGGRAQTAGGTTAPAVNDFPSLAPATARARPAPAWSRSAAAA